MEENTPLLQKALQEKEYLVLDGGLATTLELDGHVLDKEMWSAYTAVTSPSSITSVHERFFDAGSDIIITSSYQMSYEGFKRKGLCHDPSNFDDPANKILRASTAYGIAAREKLSVERRKFAYVASSIGPYGAHLCDGSEYTGLYGVSENYLKQWHSMKLQTLTGSGADLLAFETIPCLDECKAVCSLIAEQDEINFLNGWISFCCRSDEQLSSGESFEDALRTVLDPTIDRECKSLEYLGLGVNCTNPECVNGLLDIASTVVGNKVKNPLVLYPNKGEIWNEITRKWESDSGASDDEFVRLAAGDWFERGARIIGGCCRTTPTTIRRLHAALRHQQLELDKLMTYTCKEMPAKI